MKVIFLDVDGVLNNFDTIKRNRKRNIFEESEVALEEEKIKLLKQIVDKTDAKIVLSSSWRIFFDANTLEPQNKDAYELSRLFYKYSLRIHSLTKRSLTGCREDEINEWLEHHKDIESFVILDDEENQLQSFKNNALIKTDFFGDEGLHNGGLTEEHVEQAIKVLMKKMR